MKQFLVLILFTSLVAACSSEISENREIRSTIYQGQTTWDMYENFGAPTKAIKISDKEYHFIYQREEVTRDWTNMYFDWCDMDVTVIDDRVADWNLSGNQCYLNVADPIELNPEYTRDNITEPYQNDGVPNTQDDEDTLF